MKQSKINYASDKTEAEESDSRPVCKYGAGCYRKNPDHQKQFKHPRDSSEVVSPPAAAKKVRVEESLESSATPAESDPLLREETPPVNSPNKEELGPEKEENIPSPPSPDTQGASDNNNKSSKIKYDQLLPSDDAVTIVKKRFFIELPKSCLQFWDFCLETNKDSPCSALTDLGMELVGPFQVLEAASKGVPPDEIMYNCMQHRYYFDPPELLTCILTDPAKGSHIGFYTDHPLTQPDFMAFCPNKDNCTIKPVGDNLFQAVLQLQQGKESEVMTSLEEFAKNNSICLNATAFKLRKKRVVADTFHCVGIVVPYDPKTELGYRPLNLSNTQLKSILSQATTAIDGKKRSEKLDKLQELITYVQFANDEGDPGMGLELGIDLLCNGNKLFTSHIFHLLTVGYDLLGREQYRWVIEEQMDKRRQQK